MPEAEVGTDHDVGGLQRACQHVVDEVHRGEVAQRVVERQRDDQVHVLRGERGKALLERHQQGRTGAGVDDLHGVAVEGDHHRAGVAFRGDLQRPCDQGLVAPVDTVEEADGHHGRRRLDVVESDCDRCVHQREGPASRGTACPGRSSTAVN